MIMCEFRSRRIINEVVNLVNVGIRVNCTAQDDENFTVELEITGPAQTPYAGGKFVLEAKLSPEYPLERPQMHFKTKLWHPNICSCYGTLQLKTFRTWTAGTLLTCVVSEILELLIEPDLDIDAMEDVSARQMMLSDCLLFEKTAMVWTRAYACGTSIVPDFDQKLDLLTRFCGSLDLALFLLSENEWKVLPSMSDYNDYSQQDQHS